MCEFNFIENKKLLVFFRLIINRQLYVAIENVMFFYTQLTNQELVAYFV